MSRKTRKLMWSVPLIAAVAVIGALAAFMTMSPAGLFASGVTNQPMNLEVAPASGSEGRTALVLTWDAPSSGETPTGYRIDVSKDNMSYTFLAMTDADTRTYTHMGIPGSTSGTDRYYRVFAMNAHGAGKVSTWEIGTTKKITTPGQVKPFDWTSTDPTKVVLTWTAPEDGGADILGYCIRAWPTGSTPTGGNTLVSISASNCTNSFATEGPGGDAGDYRGTAFTDNDQTGGIIRILPAETYTHSGLKAKQNWSYEIYAVNEHGYSSKVSATRNATTAAAKNPSPPGSLLALQDTSTTTEGRRINLYWTAPDAMGQNITGYEIEVSDRANHWPNASRTRPAATARLSTKAVTGADAANGQLAPETPAGTATAPNTDPAFGIIAINADSQNPTTTGDVTTAQPFQLQHIYLGTERDASGTIEADEIVSTLYYRVRTITNNDAENSEMKSTSYVSTSVSLSFDTDTATTLDGFEAPILAPLVGADAASTAGAAANQDTNGSDTADAETDKTPSELRLHTSHQTDGSSSYRVDVSTNFGATWTTHEAASRPISHYDFRGPVVEPGKRYFFRLFSKKGGFGLASAVVQDYAGHTRAPGGVRNLTATPDGAGMINLSWNPPTSTGGTMIDTYCIVASSTGASNAPLRTSITLVDLSGTDDLESNCTRFGAPDESPIGIDDGVFQVEGTTTSVAFKGVMAKTQWFFRVYALNGAIGPTGADGMPTTARTSETLDAAIETALKGIVLAAESERNDATTGSAVVPDAPPYLTVEDARDTNFQGVGKQGVLILWTAPANPAGAPVLGYKVERSIDDGDYITLSDNLNTGETHFVDPSERPTDQSRVYRVTSINSVDVGTESIMAMLPLDPDHTHLPPPDLMAPMLTATKGTGSVTLMWDEQEAAVEYTVWGVRPDGSAVRAGSTEALIRVNDVTDNTHEVTGLMSGQEYWFAVTACEMADCGAGNYLHSNVVVATPD